MKKIFIVGHGPIPGESNVKCQTAFGLRTWQFLSLVRHIEVDIKLILISDPKYYTKTPKFHVTQKLSVFNQQIDITRIVKKNAKSFKIIKDSYKNFDPDVCLGVNLPAAYLLSQLHPSVPFWADLNGWAMTEGQSQAWIENTDDYLPFLWHQEKSVLKKADKISTVSQAQKYATYGELATLGRLNRFTDEYNFVTTIPNANETRKKNKYFQEHKWLNIHKKFNLPKNAFIVFLSGSYNTWLDTKTMFEGLENAMKANQNIYFISTGGSAGVSNKSFADFKTRIDNSPMKKKFHFLGWVTTEELHACYKQVHLAINIDRPNHETTFGARNRMNEWVSFEVPILSTIRSEISQELLKINGLIGIHCRDSQALSGKIIAAADNHFDLKSMTQKAKKYADNFWSYTLTIKPVIEWIHHAYRCPDYQKFQDVDNSSWIKKFKFYLKKEGIKGIWKKLNK